MSALSIKLQKYCSFLSFSLAQLIFNYFMQIRTTLQEQWRFTFLVVFSDLLITHVRWVLAGSNLPMERSPEFQLSALIIGLIAGGRMPCVRYWVGR